MRPPHWFWQVAPVWVCLVLFGVGGSRLMLAVPMMGVVLLGARRSWLVWTDWKVRISVVGGALVGAAAEVLVIVGVVAPPLLGPAYTGPFPPLPLAAAQGAVLGLLALSALSGERIFTWALGFVLVVLTGHAVDGARLGPGWAVAVAVLLVSTAVYAGFSGRRLIGFGAQAAVAGVVAVGVALLGVAGQGLVVSAIVSLLQGGLQASGVGSAPLVGLAAASHVSASDQVVMEIEGEAPDRLRSSVLARFDGEVWRSDEVLSKTTPARGDAQHEMEILFDQVFVQVMPASPGTIQVAGQAAARTRGALVVAPAAWGDLATIRWSPGFADDPPEPDSKALPEGLGPALLAHAPPALSTDPIKRASQLEGWLQTRFRYSLDTDLQGEGHPLEVLLREARPAYCIYFASAMVVLLRAEGHPARMVGGYLVEPPNPLTGRRLVRERDAHAWVEVWSPSENNWQSFDPTPFREAESHGWSAALRESIERLLTRLTVGLATHPERVLLDLAGSPWTIGLLVVLGLGIVRRWRREQRGGGSDWRDAAAVVGPPGPMYQEYLGLVRRLGIRPTPSWSDDELLDALATVSPPEIVEHARTFVRCYRQVRFGGEGSDEAAATALRRLEQAIKRPESRGPAGG